MIQFHQCSIRGFRQGILVFLVSTSAKKNAEEIKFLGIVKEYLSKNKIYLCF